MNKKNFRIYIKNFFSSNWKDGNIILLVAILLCFSLIAYHHLSLGFSMSSDSQRFSRWADDLIRLDFNLFEFFSIDKASHRPSLLFFLIPVLLISLFKLIFINEWQFAFLLFNLTLIFFSFRIFVKSLLIINVRPVLILLTLPILTISVDLLVWPRFILSDTIYIFIVIFATQCMIKIIIKNEINYLLIILIIFLLLTTRPSSIPVILAIIFFVIIYKLKVFSIKRNIVLFLMGMTIFAPIFLTTAYHFIEFNYGGVPKIDFLTNMVKVGMIVHDRQDTWVEIPNNSIDILYIYFLRLVSFFNPYASTFSILHIILNMFQIAIILLSILAWSFFNTETKTQDKTFFFIIILSLFVATFHSFILIDYDWRYRFPIILPLLMLFPISAENIVKKLF